MSSRLIAETTALDRRVVSKVSRKLLPFIFTLYIVAYLDRINVGFAALQMNRELGLSPAVFGFGAGLFFVGYFLFEVPSNLVLQRVGARRWIARIIISWGVVAAATAFARSAASFFILRFLLGAAEAGFFPGMILYLTYWFPAAQQAGAVALFMTATAVAGVVGGPISGALLEINGLFGLSGWQWLFILEGLPSIVLGFVALFYLVDRPADAEWLSLEERRWLIGRIREERECKPSEVSGSLRAGLTGHRVWTLALLYFAIVIGNYGIGMWIPQIIKGLGVSGSFRIGLVSAIPFFVAAITMVAVGKSSDRTGERRWHLAASAFVGALGLLLSAHSQPPAIALAALSLAAAGIAGTLGPFWAIPPEFLDGTAAAGGIALINSVGNLGGFFGPYVVGVMKQLTNGFGSGLAVLAVLLAGAGLLALGVCGGPAGGQRR